MITKCESDIIKNLRFPLILGVVMIHNRIINPTEAWNNGWLLTSYTINLFTHYLASPCVPLFFFISGQLFFLRKDSDNRFTNNQYLNKIRRRFHTLVVPYLFWNFVVLCFYLLLNIVVPGKYYNGSWPEYIRSFWDYPDNMPINYPFWFLRDLIVMVLITPIVYYIIKPLKWAPIVVLLSIWLYLSDLLGGGNWLCAITFFSIGATFSINNYNFAQLANAAIIIVLPLWLVSISVSLYLHESHGLIPRVVCLLGILLYLAIGSRLADNRILSFLSGSSFFVCAFHGVPAKFINSLMISIIHPNSDALWALTFLTCVTTTTTLSIGLYWLLKKTLPNVTNWIIGGR